MNRCLAVKNLALLPGCLPHAEEAKASLPLKHLNVSASQEKTLAEVCEIIIPKINTPGAQDRGLHQYVLKMLNDCTPGRSRELSTANGRLLAYPTRARTGLVAIVTQLFTTLPAA